MYICTDRDAVDSIYAAKTPRPIMEAMRETYPDATMDADGRFHAPYDGYECPLTGELFRGGEYLPSNLLPEVCFGDGSSNIYSAEAIYNGEVVEWNGSRGQIDAVREELKRQSDEVDRVTSKHVGEVKKRITFSANIVAIKTFEGCYGFTYFHVLRSTDGNIFVYKGSKRLVSNRGRERVNSVTVTCTIKSHSEYNGVKQTIIERPKVAA